MTEEIKFSDWQKLDIRTAEVLKVEELEGADKLYKIEVNLGTEKRTLVAGLKPYYKPEQLKGRKVIVFTNLEPRTIKGIESQGMVLAAVTDDHGKVCLLQPDADIEPGSRIN